MKRITLGTIATYLILLLWSLVVLFPLYTMLVNSVKPHEAIFRNPFNIYWPPTFDGYRHRLERRPLRPLLPQQHLCHADVAAAHRLPGVHGVLCPGQLA